MKCIFKNTKRKAGYAYFITNLYDIIRPGDTFIDPSSKVYMKISSLELLIHNVI